jgi:alkylated DNA repair dioxygenase AlkB
MKPYYFRSGFGDIVLDDVLNSTPWIKVTDARLECFMSARTETYTYGEGRGVRTYTPVPYSPLVADIQRQLNRDGLERETLDDVYMYNVCFLNRYDNAAMQLGWHSDDSPGMDHEHPIAVVSFGQPREIWWREKGQTGVIPADQRQLLEHGSIFVMPAGMQRTHQHRIPKGDKPMGLRVSLTYRHYDPEEAWRATHRTLLETAKFETQSMAVDLHVEVHRGLDVVLANAAQPKE